VRSAALLDVVVRTAAIKSDRHREKFGRGRRNGVFPAPTDHRHRASRDIDTPGYGRGSDGSCHFDCKMDGLIRAARCQLLLSPLNQLVLLVPGEGFEPPTFGLQNRCTATVLTRPILLSVLTYLLKLVSPETLVATQIATERLISAQRMLS
jgi:hypothetical protein